MLTSHQALNFLFRAIEQAKVTNEETGNNRIPRKFNWIKSQKQNINKSLIRNGTTHKGKQRFPSEKGYAQTGHFLIIKRKKKKKKKVT